jgi:hypothetical protein
MESWANLLLILGPVAAVALAGAGVASAIAFWQYGWRAWKTSFVFALMGAAAVVTTFQAVR